MKKKLRKIIEDNTSKKGRVFDYCIQVLILLSLLAFTIETLPNNSVRTLKILNNFELVCVAIFSIEYLLRIFVAKKPLQYIFSFYGMIDFIAIFPFYLNKAYDLRSLRAFRIFRIFRALKLIRYNKALKRFSIAAKIVREEMILFLMITGIFIFIASAGIYYFENEAQPEIFTSVLHSGWWAVVTLTTVGYGDVYPITVGGKIFTFFILIIGVGIVTIPAGLVASALAKAREMQEK
tara:strand:+ start:272 stop:979 length:708 start_codon:yes stop_codon:yes gene_type:complete